MSKPILFSGPMVRAILEGRKTQTRRVLKYEWFHGCMTGDCPHERQTECDACLAEYERTECPHGVPGDRLWLRETWWHIPEPSLSDLRDGADTWPEPIGPQEQRIAYTADGDDPDVVRRWGWKLRPSIFMPRWASRITLEITDVRLQRLQEISEEDAAAEGITEPHPVHGEWCDPAKGRLGHWSYRKPFSELWDSINAKRGFGWDVNPWVWAITFKREQP